MIKKTIRITCCALAATFVFSTLGIHAEATTNLPCGGVELVLRNGTDLETVVSNVNKYNVNGESGITIIEQTDVKATETIPEEPSEEDTFSNLVIAQVSNYVNVRNLPSEEGEIIGKLYDNSVGTYISEENGWYQIKSGSVTGYVKAEYCVTRDAAVELAKEVGTRMATVTTTTLKVRKEPSLEAPVLGLVPLEEELVVKDETDGWVQVDVEEGLGWVSSDYVELHTEFVEAESREEEEARLKKEEEARKKANAAAAAAQKKKKSSSDTTYTSSGDSELGKSVADYALQFVGNPYVWGGTSLTEGADCSGFVMSVYAHFGISLPHSSAEDRKQGYSVDGIDNAQPGDLVCYSGHVGLYIGDGKIVHASSSKTGIIVSNATYKEILAVRRIF